MSNVYVAGLRHGILLVNPKRTSDNPNARVAVAELLNLGWLVDPRTLNRVEDAELVRVLDAARTVAGVDRSYTPLYPNFPAQVRDLSTLELIIDQILHYWTLGAPLVDQTVVVRPGLPLADMLTASKPLSVVSKDAGAILAHKILVQAMALSEQDVDLVRAILRTSKVNSSLDSLFEGVTNRENRQHLVLALNANKRINRDVLAVAALRNALDSDDALRTVLALYTHGEGEKYERAARHLSDVDYGAVMMDSMPNEVRETLVIRLGSLTKGFRADSLVGHRKMWRRVMRYVHPYSTRAARNVDSRRALDIIHSNIEYKTYASLVEEAFANGDMKTALGLLENNAGNLYRRLSQLLDNGVDSAELVAVLGRVGDKPRMTTLISAYNGLQARASGRDGVLRVAGRSNFMRDNTTRKKVSKTDLKAVTDAVRAAMERKIIAGTDAPSKAVAVSSDAPVNLVRRDAAVSDRSVNRGERFTLAEDGNVLRVFVQWYNGKHHRVDLDLGAVLLDSQYRQVASVDYASYHNKRGYATYSGDLVDAPGTKGAAEFIDIDLNAVGRVQPNAEWVAMTVNSYTGQPLDDVDHFAGAMIRTDGDKGAIFDPRTVTNAFTSVTKSTRVAPLIVNLRTREMVWIDTSDGANQGGYSVSRGGALTDAIAFELDVKRLTEGELARMYAKAHGARTVNKAVDADLIGKLTGL